MKFRLFALLSLPMSLLALLAAPAWAGPREDSLASASRCGSYSADRQFLECYYGAAQPMRAFLVLPPASPAQQRLAAQAAPSAGGPYQGVIAGAGRCLSYADNRQWLDCYYGAVQSVRARLGLPGASAAQQSLAAAAVGATSLASAAISHRPAIRRKKRGWFAGMFGGDDTPVPASQFGMMNDDEPVGAGGDREVDHISAQMASYSFNKLDGTFTVTLANGQVWRQVQGDTTYAHWHKPASRYYVNIEPGIFGSFDLTVNKIAGRYKVHRIS